MIINELYKTEITCTPLVVGEVKTVTIRLLDFNNNPLKSKQVTVYCDKGYFTSNNQQSVTSTTDATGKLDLNYTSNDGGIVTFKANNTSFSSIISGWKEVTPNIAHASGYTGTYTVKLYINDLTQMGVVSISLSTRNYGTGKVDHLTIKNLSSDGEYQVVVPPRTSGYYPGMEATITADGLFYIVSDTARSQSSLGFNFVFPFNYR